MVIGLFGLSILALLCVRFRTSEGALTALAQALGIQPQLEGLELDEDVFPGNDAVILNAQNLFLIAQWGLIPQWAKDPKKAAKGAYNARSETVGELPTFREAYDLRRCVIPIRSFLEQDSGHWWEVSAVDEQPIFLAGLWEPPYLTNRPTFTILTTTPTDIIRPIQDRMPVILSRNDLRKWMGRHTPQNDLRSLMAPSQRKLRIEDAGSTKRKTQDSRQSSLFDE